MKLCTLRHFVKHNIITSKKRYAWPRTTTFINSANINCFFTQRDKKIMSMLIDNLLKDITYGRKRLSILFSCLGYEGYETIQRTSLSGQRKVQQKLNQFNQPIQYYHIKSLQIFHESRQKNLDGNVFCDDT